jgi:hypothetical protein
MKAACLLVLGSWLLLTCGVRAQSQPAQHTGDQAKPQAGSSKDDTKPQKTGAATEVPAKTPANSTAPTPASPSASATSAAKPSAAQQPRPANGRGMVWVNTESGVYHKPGTRYYGKTKQGKYMTEADAIKAGYHAAKKE